MEIDPRNPPREPRFPAGYSPRLHELIPMPDWVMIWKDGSHPVPEEWRHVFPDTPEVPRRKPGLRGWIRWLFGPL